MLRNCTRTCVCLLGASVLAAAPLLGQDSATPEPDPASVLTPEQWEQVDRSVDRALAWLASQQQADGSFATHEAGQPAVTALCLLAFLSGGHLPGEGPYGQLLDRGIDHVLSCQMEDGLFSRRTPEPHIVWHSYSHTAMYNHAIAGLLLCEVYGVTDEQRAERMRPTIRKAIIFTRKRQLAPKQDQRDLGGWRYLRRSDVRDSDLSITSWQLMFLRSAKNAGFEVPGQWIDEAVAYVQRCVNPQRGVTEYYAGGHLKSRAMAGAGVLALSHAGLHNTPIARSSGQWILRHPFNQYNRGLHKSERYHYGVFYCTQGMFQLGGEYWQQFFPPVVNVLLDHQNRDGSWATESAENDSQFGSSYTTSLVLLALTAPNQLLPIFQR